TTPPHTHHAPTFIFFHTPPPPQIYPLSLHDALPIFISSACPLSPIRSTIGPTSSSTGFTRSNASGSPPTMIDAFPCSTVVGAPEDRKSTRLNSSHVAISYAVFCLKKKKKTNTLQPE